MAEEAQFISVIVTSRQSAVAVVVDSSNAPAAMMYVLTFLVMDLSLSFLHTTSPLGRPRWPPHVLWLDGFRRTSSSPRSRRVRRDGPDRQSDRGRARSAPGRCGRARRGACSTPWPLA